MSGNGQQAGPGQGTNGANVLQGGVQVNANGQNLVTQLLGLNQDHGVHGSHGGGQGPLAQNVQGSGNNWNSTIRSLKLSDAFQGINVTPNFLFLMLFLGFTAWLYVVYWIRHHEPLANDVLGTGAAHSATTAADRALVAGIKRTLPVRTSQQTGDFYVPVPQGNGQFAASGDFGSPAAAYGHPLSASVPLPQPPLPEPPSPMPPAPTPLGYGQYPYMAPQQPIMQSQRDAYLMPMAAPTGARLKMIVNR